MITPEVNGIYIVDVADIMRHRSTKHCVCVAVGAEKYITINTSSRPEQDELKINASDYAFLNGVDRFVFCAKPIARTQEKLIERAGTLSEADARAVYAKIEGSNKISPKEKEKMLPELWRTFK